MSIAGPLIDAFGRMHTDLRVSVTDRCNMRCFYCMPAEGVTFAPHDAILKFEEIERLVRVAARLGHPQGPLDGRRTPRAQGDLPVWPGCWPGCRESRTWP